MGKLSKMRKLCKGFTLAEVLVTLAVIGVVAALTIPGLIQKSTEKECKAKFKKSYSAFSQVVAKIVADNGSLAGFFADHNTMKNKFKEYLQYIKECDEGASLGACWHANDGSYKFLNGSSITMFVNPAGLILNDGTFIMTLASSSTCSNPIGTTGYTRCGAIYIDVNGWKGPNTIGRDVFYIHILEDRVLPHGLDNGSYDADTTCVSTSTGLGCAAKVLRNEDY